MCGFAGMFHFGRDFMNCEAETLLTVSRMRNVLLHRGPDARGIWVGNHAAFAHARLSVIDPEHGDQPMRRVAEGQEYVVCYNGELYNAAVLTRELKAMGHTFETTCDTEVLLLSYIAWGEACVDKLEGIFAFAIWDGARNRAFFCRDRLGVKPLFFAEREGGILFASELKGLLANRAVKPNINAEGLAEVLGVGPARTPGFGVYENVFELKPGECMTMSEAGVNRRIYWKLESRPHTENFEDTVAHVRELLSGAIRRQLVSDVPLCTFLSGGLDSSIITAYAAQSEKAAGRQLSSYSFDYMDNARYFNASDFQPDSDEPYAQEVSRFWNTQHETLICHNHDLPGALYAAMRARDLPGMTDVDASLLLFCRKVRARHVVALSGECADEVFGGYPWFHRKEFLQSDTFPWQIDPEARYNVLDPEIMMDLKLSEFTKARCADMRKQTPTLNGEDAQEARRREISFLNIYGFMQMLLERKDRMSMACGLEVRVPFADAALVDYVFNVPWEMKAYNGEAKGLLRAAASGILPESILRRKKSPYPKTHNPLYEDLVKQRILEMLRNPHAPVRDLINLSRVRALLEGKADYSKPWFGQLMAGPQLLAWILQLNAWLEEYKIQFV